MKVLVRQIGVNVSNWRDSHEIRQFATDFRILYGI